MSRVGLGPSHLMERLQCLVIKIWSPSSLDQKSVARHCNLWRWQPQLCPLAIFNILFQLLVIENAIHFQIFPFEIGLDVKKIPLKNQIG